jgi:hypothetical protein
MKGEAMKTSATRTGRWDGFGWGLCFCIAIAVIGAVSSSANVYAGHTGSYSIELVGEPDQAFLPADHGDKW